MIDTLVRIRLLRGGNPQIFVGWLDRIYAEPNGSCWIAAEGRWQRYDGSYFKEQNLNRPLAEVRSIEAVDD